MKHPIAVAALAILSALPAHAAEITITYLPYTITAPGTYVLKSNLSYPGPTEFNVAAISIQASEGPVVLDMKGFTITGLQSNLNDTTGIAIFDAPNPLIIRNGSLVNFQNGISAYSFQEEPTGGITIDKMIFNLDPATPGAYGEVGVILSAVRNSTISNCSFSNGSYGIIDNGSPGGNAYSDDYFAISITEALLVEPFNASYTAHGERLPIRINRCSFATPTQ
jgi:hypothetical protein